MVRYFSTMVWILLLFLSSMMAATIDAMSTEVVAFQEKVLGRATVDAPRRQLLGAICIGPTQIYYFEVEIRLVPDENTSVCNVADQVLLGNEINQLLEEYGLGEAGADDDAVFHAAVCPQPITARRRQLRIQTNGFIWNGGGGCRYCFWDNFDHRNLLFDLFSLFGGGDDNENWFTETFAPAMEPTLEDAIRSRIVPNRQNCLGINPIIDVMLTQVSLKDLDFQCEDGKVIESLQSLRLGDVPLQRDNCGSCVSLDFSQNPDRTPLEKGDWVKGQWHENHGLLISATGGYSPLFRARIFDTGDTSCTNEDGTHDFGSPNKHCTNHPGDGTGQGGRPGEGGENCDPVGNVLIIQESNTECPDSNTLGGTIAFQWDEPVMLSDIGLMDIDESEQRIRIHYADGFFETFTYEGFGDNAVQRVVASKLNVVKVEIIFSGTGAVTEINFCPECSPRIGHDTDHHCLYTQDEQQIQSQEVKYFQNFNTKSSKKKWKHGKHHTNKAGVTMLGKYQRGDDSPYETFRVDRRVTGVIFELDFYEIGFWENDDKARIFVDAEGIDLGIIHSLDDEGDMDTTSIGVTWQHGIVGNTTFLDNVGSEEADHYVRHHVKVIVPEASGLYGDGKLRLTLKANFKARGSDERAIGWDNVKVTVIHKCRTASKSVPISSKPTQPPAISPTRSPTRSPTSRSPTPPPTGSPTPPPTQPPPPSPSPKKLSPTSPAASPAQPQTKTPAVSPTRSPTRSPSRPPTRVPTRPPTKIPTKAPTRPTPFPSKNPTKFPSNSPTKFPSKNPTKSPTKVPTLFPTKAPARNPSRAPTRLPSKNPTKLPSKSPTKLPSKNPAKFPTRSPTIRAPTKAPTRGSTCGANNFQRECTTTGQCQNKYETALDCNNSHGGVCFCAGNKVCGCLGGSTPTRSPTIRSPTKAPTRSPTQAATRAPTKAATRSPTKAPTRAPTKAPTKAPTTTCGATNFQRECTTTGQCQSKYETALDCSNFHGGVCFCAGNKVCGCGSTPATSSKFPTRFPTRAPTAGSVTRFPTRWPTAGRRKL